MESTIAQPESLLKFESKIVIENNEEEESNMEGLRKVKKEQFSFKETLASKEFTFVGNSWTPKGLEKQPK